MGPDEIEDVDQSTAESLPVGEAVETEETQEEEIKINPAWEDMLSRIPEEFHPAITPKLFEWDGNFQKVQQQLAPYKEIIDNEIPFESIQQSLQIRDLLEHNPRGVYDFLVERYNFNNAVQQPTGPEEKDEEEFAYDGEENFDISKHPKVKELETQLGQMQSYVQQQMQRDAEIQVQQEIQTEFSTIGQKFNNGQPLTEEMKSDIARLAMGAGDNDLTKAANDYFTRFHKPAPVSPTAPPVIKGGSRVVRGMTPADIGKISDPEERVKAVVAMMEANARANQD